METMKEGKDQVVDAEKKGKGKLEDLQKKDWAEPTASALNFEDEEVAKLIEKAKEMEAKAKNGHIREASSTFTEIFEEMKTKKFTASQRTLQCDLYSKIVKFHNEKHFYNEALVWTFKIFDVFNPDTSSTRLKIDVCVNSAIAFLRKNEMGKAKALIEKAVALAEKEFGPKSSMYADTLLAYSEYLDKTDQHQKNSNILETALEIVEREEGKESVAYASILSCIALNNVQHERFRYRSVQQARQAVEILTKEVGEDNFLLVKPKNVLACLIHDNAMIHDDAMTMPSEDEKAMLLNEVEMLQREIIEVCKSHLGEFNPFTTHLMASLGLTWKEMGKLAEVEEMFNNSMKILVAIQGPDDLEVARIHNRLAVLYEEDLEDFSKAEEHHLQSIRIAEKLFGPAFSKLQFSYVGLISLYQKTGDESKMVKYEEKYKEWRKLQEEKKSMEEKEEDEKMDIEAMVEFVKNT